MKINTYTIECAKARKTTSGVWENGVAPLYFTIAETKFIDAVDKAAFALMVANRVDDDFTYVYLTKTSGVHHSWFIEYNKDTLSFSMPTQIC